MTAKKYKNHEISLSMLPSPDDKEAIYNFALTLECTSGYDSFGEALNNEDKLDLSFTDMRHEMYFAARTYEAIKTEDFVQLYRSYYDRFVSLIKAGDIG